MITSSIGLSSNMYFPLPSPVVLCIGADCLQNQTKGQDGKQIAAGDQKEDDKRPGNPQASTSQAVPGQAQRTSGLPPRAGVSGTTPANLASQPRRVVQRDTPDTSRAVQGSDRLLRSQSRGQGVPAGGAGSSGAGPAGPARAGSGGPQQQQWY